MRSEGEDGDCYGLVMPFVIDGDGYSDRDRALFVAGYEFCQLHVFLEENPQEGLDKPIHCENEDRVRVLCGRLGRTHAISPIDETWCRLVVGPLK